MAVIKLNKGYYALVDDEDYHRLSQYRWFAVEDALYERIIVARNTGYSGRLMYLHRQVLDVEVGVKVTHLNLDGLDNRKANLRVVTRSQVQSRRRNVSFISDSGFKGVNHNPYTGRFSAVMKKDNHKIYLGSFSSAEAAAAAYDKALREEYGDLAVTNFPERSSQWLERD